jgi:hypothetical protein
LQRGDIDLGEFRFRRQRKAGGVRCGGRGWGWPRLDQAGGVALGQGFDGIRFGEDGTLPREQRIDAGAQARPVPLGQVEMAAKVEQGDLADLLAAAFGNDETVGEI